MSVAWDARDLAPGAPEDEGGGPWSWRGGALDPRPLARSGYGLGPIALLILLGFFAAMDGEGFTLLSPLIKHDLGLNFLKFFTITTVVSTLALLFAGPLGYVADRARRTALVGIGGALLGVASLLTGLAATPLTLGAARALAGAANDLNRVPQFSLLVDYYPVDQRVRMVTLLGAGGAVGAIITLPLIGWLASTYGWRVPFYAIWIPMILISLVVMLGLREPVRGYQERRALGVPDDLAKRAQPKPTQAESWRLIWSSRVLRYMLYSTAVLTFAGAFTSLRSFYFFQIWHQNPAQLAAIQTANNIADLVALLVGGGLINWMARRRPHSVLRLTAVFSAVTALFSASFVLAPVLWLSIGTGVLFGAIGTLVSLASLGLILNVMPPRARGQAVGVFAYFAIPGLLLSPFVGQMADSLGLKATVLIGSIFPVLAAIIQYVSAKFYESDVRNAELSAAATLAHEEALQAGTAKMLIARKVDVHYGAVQVLFGVDLDIEAGDIVAILGTNGAGKSTLLRSVAGLNEASGGAIVLDGDDITHLPPNEIAAKGVVYVQGGRSIFPSLTVRENLRVGSWRRRNRAQRRQDLDAVFGYFPVLHQRLDQVAASLSTGEQQMLALGCALLTRPRLLMVDELSLGLAPAVVQSLLGILRNINAAGTTVVVIEQSVEVALSLARRAVFMERGRVQFSGPAEELRARPDLLRAVFLRGSASMEESGVLALPVSGDGARRRSAAHPEQMLLDVVGISKRFGGREALSDVSLSLRRGEILGIIGPNGAGKTTLLDIVSGLTMPDAGSVLLAGADITLWTPDRRAREGVCRRFRDARLFPTLTVEEIVALAVQQSEDAATAGSALAPWRPRRSRTAAETVDALIELMRLQRYRESVAADLSTGTRRLVDLACAIASAPQLLLLDEPATGLAQAETEELEPILRQLRSRLGCAMVVVEHDVALVSALADQLMALHLGRVLARGTSDAVLNDEAVVAAYLGHGTAASRSLVGAQP